MNSTAPTVKSCKMDRILPSFANKVSISEQEQGFYANTIDVFILQRSRPHKQRRPYENIRAPHAQPGSPMYGIRRCPVLP